MIELIAHRAGNAPSTLEMAATIADAVELDVHQFRGRLEVRHAKIIWPTSVRWERWALVPRSDRRPTLGEIVDELSPDVGLWIDLKGFRRSLTHRVLATTARFDRVTMSSRSWWVLAPARQRPGVRCVRSIGSRWQRWVAERVAPHVDGAGGFAIDERLLRSTTLARVRPAGPVVAWGATDVRRVRELEAMGVQGVIVDSLDLIRSLRSTREP